MKPLLTIGALDHISYFLALPFFVQLTTREQQALRTRSKYFEIFGPGGPYISGVQIFRDRSIGTQTERQYYTRYDE